MLNRAFALVLTTVTSTTPTSKGAVGAQARSTLILPFPITLTLISAGVTESIITLMLLLNTALQANMIMIHLVALHSSSFMLLLPSCTGERLQSSEYCNSVLGKSFLIAGEQIPQLIYIWQVWLSQRTHGYRLQVGNPFNKPPMKNDFFYLNFWKSVKRYYYSSDIHTFPFITQLFPPSQEIILV